MRANDLEYTRTNTSETGTSETGTYYSKDNLPPWTIDYPTLEKDSTGSIDVEKLLDELDDTHTEWMDGVTSETLRDQRIEALSELNLDQETLTNWLMKLEMYRVVDELQHLQIGRYVRWIPLTDPENLRLIHGGFVCGIYIEDTGIEVEVLAHRKYVQHFSFDNVLLFQRFTKQEEILLSLIDYLEGDQEDYESTVAGSTVVSE